MTSDGLKKALEHLRQVLPPPEQNTRTDGQLLASFVATRDETAFAALVRLHGRMVFAVCRRVLGHVQDAEDAFQATFLVLARKASSLRNGEAVGNWLYGVAYRTALEAKACNARRRTREKQLVPMSSPVISPAEPRDWLPVLERALNRLPERYRTPLVLCHLEGRSRQEVARLLGLPEGTLSSRLATARQMLAKRLAGHHLAMSMGVLLAALSDEAASACVPASLLVSTVQDALRVAAGQTITTPAAVLMKEVLQMMFLTKLKLLTVFLAAVGVLGLLTASFFAPMRAADEKPSAEPTRAAEPAAKGTLTTRITRFDKDVGDVESLLHIFKEVSEVAFRPGVRLTTLGVDIDVYKDGEKKKSFKDNLSNIGVEGMAELAEDKPDRRAKIAVLAADLDYLPLAEARKDHCRMQVNLAVGGNKWHKWFVGASSSVDVPKEVFDFSRTSGRGQFPPGAGSATETPLFYVIARSNQVTGMNTVPELIEKNAKGDVLIVYLRLRK